MRHAPTGPPPWLGQEEDEERLAELRSLSPEERLQMFVEACELATAILRERPDAREVLDNPEPLSPESEARWLGLIAEARRAESSR